MQVVITGGAGFIGSHLTQRLIDEGHDVSVFDNLSTGNGDRVAQTGARLIAGDVRDEAAIRKAVSGMDAVFHCAAVVGVPHAMKRQWDSLTTNILGTVNILQAARQTQTPVFLASSSAIYGKLVKSPVSEEDDVLLGNTHKSSWTYSYAKLAEELIARAASQEWAAPVKIARFFNVIGPGQSAAYGMVVPRFVSQARRNQPLLVYGDGTQTRTFVDVEDAVDAVRLVWEHGRWGGVYNIGGIEEISIHNLAKRIIGLTHSASAIAIIPYERALGPGFEETLRRQPSIKNVAALGYHPRYTLDESILRIVSTMTEESEWSNP